MVYNYLDKYYWLVNLIKSHKYITLKEIQYAWDICYLNDARTPLLRRTFIKQKDAIKSILHIEIQYQKYIKGYYIDDADYNVDRMVDMALASNSLIKFAQHPGMAHRFQIRVNRGQVPFTSFIN